MSGPLILPRAHVYVVEVPDDFEGDAVYPYACDYTSALAAAALVEDPMRLAEAVIKHCLGQGRDAEAALKALLDAGLDVNARDGEGRTMLHRLAQDPYYLARAARILGELGVEVDVNARDNRGKTPLHYLLEAARRECGEPDFPASSYAEALARLLRLGADLDAPDGDGVTPREILACIREDAREDILSRYRRWWMVVFNLGDIELPPCREHPAEPECDCGFLCHEFGACCDYCEEFREEERKHTWYDSDWDNEW